NLAIKAVEGLKIDLKHIDQKTVSQTIDAMVQADPQLAWLKEAEQRGDVDWRMVQEVHDSWKYSNSGMGPATQIAVAIAAAAIGGMAAAGALSGAGVGASSFAMGAGVGAAGSLSGTAAVSLINNKGDLGKVLKDSFSSDSLKQIAIASLTGGLTAEYFDGILQTKTDPLTGKVTVDLSSLSGVGRFAANQAMQNATSTVLSQALGQGGSLNEALKSALYNSFAAAGFNFVGDIGQEYSLKPGDPSMVTMHALMGGLAAQVSGGDFATGAAAAGANEALVAKLDQAFKSLSPENREAMVTMGSQLVGVLAAAVRDPDVTGKALESAAWVAKNSTQYNFLNHQDVADLDNALQKCKSQGNCRQVEEEFKARSDENRRRLNGCVAAGNCAEIRAEIDAGSTALNELVARQETANPGGSDSDIAYGFLMGRNVVDWTTAGQLHLEQTANLWWNGNPQWQKEVGAYLDQTGFNPFGIGVPAMGGAAGKVSAKALMNALKAGELPKGEVAPGKANLPTIGALADAEAGMPYTHPVKPGAKGAVIPKGFSNADDFARFGTDAREGLAKAGYGNVEPILQGSAITGQSFKTGQAFDVGRVSDFDIALAGSELLQRAQSLGIGLRSGGTRTGPLSGRDLQALGLKDLARKLSAQAGREVNFMIYDSAATAASRAPSLVLPK
ncbi:TPA: DUF637 domain-containing protein, partial [Pseudomonas aeruginosa]